MRRPPNAGFWISRRKRWRRISKRRWSGLPWAKAQRRTKRVVRKSPTQRFALGGPLYKGGVRRAALLAVRQCAQFPGSSGVLAPFLKGTVRAADEGIYGFHP